MARLSLLLTGVALVGVVGFYPTLAVLGQAESSAGDTGSATATTPIQPRAGVGDSIPNDIALPSDSAGRTRETVQGDPILRGRAGLNLQVLPIDTIKELLTVMKSYNQALGVTCTYCHVMADDEQSFSKDDKSHKIATRKMILLERQINKIMEPDFGVNKTTCYTCHRGSKYPRKSPPKPKKENER